MDDDTLDTMYRMAQALQIGLDRQKVALDRLSENLDKLLQLQESTMEQLKEGAL